MPTHRYALLLLALHSIPAAAQVFASEHGLVAQTVNGATITVDYYRPRARGRELFGKVVPWGRPWTPGANWATTLEVDRDVTIEGQPLPKGKYSVWTVPQPTEWTVNLHRTARVFHTFEPAAEDVQLRFTVKPAEGAHMERLTWWFPVVEQRSAELHLQWGTTDVALHIDAGAGVLALGPQERATYVGTYRMAPVNPASRIKASMYTVFDSAGVLRLRRNPPPDQFYDAQYDLQPLGGHRFAAVMYQKGTLVGVEPAITILFSVDGSRATGVEVVSASGPVMARGAREGP